MLDRVARDSEQLIRYKLRTSHGWHAILCIVRANCLCILRIADGRGCPSSQIAIAQPSAVPLWKVIVGPRADKLQTRTRKGPVFFCESHAGGGTPQSARQPGSPLAGKVRRTPRSWSAIRADPRAATQILRGGR